MLSDVSRGPSFGISRPIPPSLRYVVEACHYLGLPETAFEAADIILTDERPVETGCQLMPWLVWKDLTVHRQGSLLSITYGDWQVVLDVLRRRVTPVRVPFVADATIPYEFLSYLRLVLLFLLRRLGWFELHGGACVHSGKGYVFTGPPGSGKTSAVLSLIEAGWDYVSDDALLVRQVPQPGATAAICLRAGRIVFSVTSATLDRFPALRPHAERRWQRTEKWVVNPAALWPQQHVLSVQPAFLFFCQLWEAEETRVLPLAATDALSHLMANSPWLALDRETAAAHLATYRKLAESCYSFALLAGRDVWHEPSRLAAYLTATDLVRLHCNHA